MGSNAPRLAEPTARNLRRVHVIVNPAAGKPEPLLGTLNTLFRDRRVDWTIDITQRFGDGARMVSQAVEQGAEAVLVYGGDGTVSDVANGLIGVDVPLGILPGGTGNVLARSFGISSVLTEAVAQVLDSPVMTVDLGRIEERYFMLRADVGISGDSTGGTSRDLKSRWGVAAYLLNIAQKLRSARPTHYRLTIDDQSFEGEAMTCFVANTNEVGFLNLTFSECVSPCDGLLDVILIEDVSAVMAGIVNQIAGRQTGAAAYFQHWQGRHIRIETEPAQKVRGDGEPMRHTPVEIEVVVGAVKVLAPGAAGLEVGTDVVSRICV